MTKTLCGQYFLTTCMKFTSEISLQQPEHGFDPSPVWCDPYLPSTDISCRPQFRRFVPSFLCCFVFSLSIFEYPKLSLSPSVFLCLCSTFFLAVFYLSPLIFFIYHHLLSLSASVSFFFFLFSLFGCLLLYPPCSSLYIAVYVCLIIIIIMYFLSFKFCLPFLLNFFLHFFFFLVFLILFFFFLLSLMILS